MPAQPTTIFAFVTQPLVAEGLAKVLETCADLEFAGYSSDPRTGMEELGRIQNGVVLLDQAFGLRVVFDVLVAIKRSMAGLRPVLWTREISPADRRLVIEGGARGIVDRTEPVSALLECLRVVSSGRFWLGELGEAAAVEHRGAQRLTQREREVVALVRAGLKNREIADRLSITPGTVKVHLMHVFEKTGARDRFELRMQAGYLLEDGVDGAAITAASGRSQ